MQHNNLPEAVFFFLLLFWRRYFELLGGQKSHLNSLRPTKLIYHRKRKAFLYLSITQATNTSEEIREGSCSIMAGVAKPASAAKQACFALDTTSPFAIPLSETHVWCGGAYPSHVY